MGEGHTQRERERERERDRKRSISVGRVGVTNTQRALKLYVIAVFELT